MDNANHAVGGRNAEEAVSGRSSPGRHSGVSSQQQHLTGSVGNGAVSSSPAAAAATAAAAAAVTAAAAAAAAFPGAGSRTARHRGLDMERVSALGHDMMSEDEQAPKSTALKRRVEGRGSSAAQRAAASEACKSISLERLQAQYHRPLSDVARDLKVSVARLLKKCREFGILRWPYRHVRSVQESIDQLEKDREASTDEMAIEDMELRLRLLRRRGELVAHFASCQLESDMRKGIFLADPRDVDTMLANAHEVHGRQVPPPGWESLGRFPDMAVRDHFLEQMRTYMIGGTAATLPPDSPHPLGQHALEDSSSSLDDNRERSRQQHMQQLQQQQQQQQAYHGSALPGPWHQHLPQQQQQQQFHTPPQPWQGGNHQNLYARGPGLGSGGGGGGAADPSHVAYPHHYWGGGSSAQGASAGGAGAGGGVLTASDYGRVRSPGHGVDFSQAGEGQTASSSLGGYPPVFYPGDQPSAAAAAVSATSVGGHGHSAGAAAAAAPTTGLSSSSSSSPSMRDQMFMSPPGGSSSSSSSNVRGGAVQREAGQMGISSWGGGGGGAAPADAMVGGGSGERDQMWRPPERWVGADLPNPPGGRGAGGVLPSIFELRQQRGLERSADNFMPGAAGLTSGLGGAGAGGGTAGAAPWGGAGGFQQDQPILGGHDHRWGGASAASQMQQQQQQHQALGHMVSSSRWQDAGFGAGGGGGSATDAGIPRGGSFDPSYGGSSIQGRHRGAGGGGGGREGEA